MTFSDSTSLYFYSAVFQGNMALLAIIGVFVVFKIQQMTSNLIEKDKIILDYIQNSFKGMIQEGKHLPEIPINYKDIGTLKTALNNIVSGSKFNDSIKSRTKELLNDSELNKRFEERKIIQVERIEVINRMKFPFIMILIVIIFSLIFLPLSNTVHHSFSRFEFYPICVLIIINIISLILNAKYIFNVLNYK
jgi:hypothetical protein